MNSDEALHGERRSKEGLSEMKQINVALAEKLAIAPTRQLFERYIYMRQSRQSSRNSRPSRQGKPANAGRRFAGRMQRDGRSSSGVEGKIGCHIGRPATPPRHSE
jgi:hypothetical protein